MEDALRRLGGAFRPAGDRPPQILGLVRVGESDEDVSLRTESSLEPRPNYPWRYVSMGIPWNLVRVVAGPLPWNGSKLEQGQLTRGRFGKTTAAMARARLDAYAGLPRALAKRREREATTRVDVHTIGRWIRTYRVSMKDAVLAW